MPAVSLFGSSEILESSLQAIKQDSFLVKIADVFRRFIHQVIECFKSLLQKINVFNWRQKDRTVSVETKTSFSENWKAFKKDPIQFAKDRPRVFIGIVAFFSLKGIATLFLGKGIKDLFCWAIS